MYDGSHKFVGFGYILQLIAEGKANGSSSLLLEMLYFKYSFIYSTNSSYTRWDVNKLLILALNLKFYLQSSTYVYVRITIIIFIVSENNE